MGDQMFAPVELTGFAVIWLNRRGVVGLGVKYGAGRECKMVRNTQEEFSNAYFVDSHNCMLRLAIGRIVCLGLQRIHADIH